MAITMEELKRKAQRYDVAIERAKEIVNNQNASSVWKDWLRNTFPELKNEDERVRKELIELIGCMHDADPRKKGWIAWLEKQGEKEREEWKEGNIIRHGGILALVIKGRRAIKSNGEIFTVQYPDEWVKASPNEIERFFNNFEKQDGTNVFDIPEIEIDWIEKQGKHLSSESTNKI